METMYRAGLVILLYPLVILLAIVFYPFAIFLVATKRIGLGFGVKTPSMEKPLDVSTHDKLEEEELGEVTLSFGSEEKDD